MPTGLLLLNLGTPDAPTTADVRRYLREFLSDPRVLDMPAIPRAILLNFVILPVRPKQSAHAYRAVWDAERGSPLMYHSRDLAAAVADKLGPAWHVELGMRYGSPSIMSAMVGLQRALCDRIVVLPLFPQYASSSTGTAIARVLELARHPWNVPSLDIINQFYDDAGFLDAFQAVAEPALAAARADHVLFSFHGLPERQIRKSDPTGETCFASADCCDARLANPSCYRAQGASRPRARSRGAPRGSRRPARGPCASSRGSARSRGSSRTPTCCSTSSQKDGRQAARGRVSGVRRRLPRDDRRDRDPRTRAVQGGRRRGRLVLVPLAQPASPAWVDAVVDASRSSTF